MIAKKVFSVISTGMRPACRVNVVACPPLAGRNLKGNELEKDYYVYIMANITNKVLYVGMTNDLLKRVYQHKNKLIPGFTSKYNVNKLIYYEIGQNVESVIKREKQIKKWRREKKEFLINKMNAEWKDLYHDIGGGKISRLHPQKTGFRSK